MRSAPYRDDYERAHIPYLAQHRRDELVDFVVEKALVAVTNFDPEHATSSYGRSGGRHFDSWICDVMTWRCTDWLRSKREGNGDARRGFGNRIVLTDEFDDDPDVDLEIERFRPIALPSGRLQRISSGYSSRSSW